VKTDSTLPVPTARHRRIHARLCSSITKLGVCFLLQSVGCAPPGTSRPDTESRDEASSDEESERNGGLDDDTEVVLDPAQVRRGSATLAQDDLPPLPQGAVPVPPPGAVLIDLGAVVVDDQGTTGTFEVEVDDRIQAFSIVAAGQADAVVIPVRVETPDGVAVVQNQLGDDTPGLAKAAVLSRGFPAQFLSPSRVFPARSVGSFPVPSTSDLPLSSGTWTFRVGHFAVELDEQERPVPTPVPRPVHVWVLARTARLAPGRLGLALHFTGAAGLTAATATTSTVFQQALLQTQNVYRDVDIDLSDVTYEDVDEGAAWTTLVLDEPFCDGGDMDALVRQGRADRLNLFFVDRFECGSLGPFLLGMSPGIPGVPWTTSTPSSGIVIAASWLTFDPDRFAVALAHEIGHWFGLFHTQENDRTSPPLYDKVADTPEAPGSRDNLMFFDVSRIGERSLTSGQARTLSQSLAVLP
jgi:hypothetical protein